MPLFLPAIARFLFRRIVGARDGSFGAVMTKRGEASGWAAWTASDGADVKGKGGNSPPKALAQGLDTTAGRIPQGA